MNNRDVSWVDKQIYETYHDKKNKEGLYYAIPFGPFCLIVYNAIVIEIIIWGYYALWCYSNNQKLRNNPKVITKRLQLIEFKREVLDVKWDYGQKDRERMGVN